MYQNEFQNLYPSDILPYARFLLLEAPRSSVPSHNDKVKLKNPSHEPEELLKIKHHIVKKLIHHTCNE